MTHNVFDFIFLEQERDSRIQLTRDVSASTNNLGPIHGDICGLELKTPLGTMRNGFVIQLRIVQQRLGWNASPIQADATKFVSLDTRNL